MNIIFEFIKSLFIPRKMARHRNNSVVIAIVLAVLTVYLFMWPTQAYYKRNTHKLVLKENLESLQVLEYFPTSGEELDKFTSEINNKEIVVDKDKTISCNNMGSKVASIKTSNKLIGLISKDYENNGFWYYKNNEYSEAGAKEITQTPKVSAVDGGIIINDISVNPIEIDGISSSDTVNTIRISLNNRSRLLINDEINNNKDILITSSEIRFSEKDNYLYVNDIKTDYELDEYTIIYYVYNSNVTYYENTFSYTGTDGYVKELKFIIDTSVNYITSYDYRYNKDTGFNGNLDTTEYYYLMLNKSGMYYQAHPLGIEDANIKHNGKTLNSSAVVAGYTIKNITLNDIDETNFGSKFLSIIENGYVDNVRTQYLFITLLDVLVMPFIFSFLFFLLFKKNGRLKKFKEYLNIASISGVIPVIIAFITIWIYPPVFSYVFLITFGVWYLFCIYRINSYNGTY